LRTDLARLDDKWSVLHNEVDHIAEKSQPLGAGDKAAMAARLDSLQYDVTHAESKVKNEFLPNGARKGEKPSRPTGENAEE
jgi:hypothetical protein